MNGFGTAEVFCGCFLEPTAASISADDVRDVINVSSAEFPDAKVLKMVKRAEGLIFLGDHR